MKRALAAALLALILAACSNTPPISPGPSVAVTSPTSTAVVAGASASPTVAPPPAITCRLSADTCAKAIGLVRQSHAEDVAQAHAIVVADVCPPSVLCDRLYPFDSLVVLVPLHSKSQGLMGRSESSPSHERSPRVSRLSFQLRRMMDIRSFGNCRGSSIERMIELL